jgi:hypothetical protein
MTAVLGQRLSSNMTVIFSYNVVVLSELLYQNPTFAPKPQLLTVSEKNGRKTAVST